jgi:uncharacterized protein
VLYVDSCALIKRYVQETGSNALNAKLSEASQHQVGIFISVVGYAEILATFARRLRENRGRKRQTELLQSQFLDDWMFELTRVELTVGVLGFIPELVNKHPLKSSDAIHLASALWLGDALQLGRQFGLANQSLTFATSDKRLKSAAAQEGLEVFDPEEKN